MSNSVRRSPSSSRPRGAGAAVVDELPADVDGTFCTCCEPNNPLVMRPDFGVLSDGSAEYALCVLHEPDPSVYRQRGDGVYQRAPELSLNAAGEVVDSRGNVIAGVLAGGFQRLTTVDDDDPPGADAGGSGRSGGTGGAGARPAQPDPGPGGAARPATYHVDLSKDDFYR